MGTCSVNEPVDMGQKSLNPAQIEAIRSQIREELASMQQQKQNVGQSSHRQVSIKLSQNRYMTSQSPKKEELGSSRVFESTLKSSVNGIADEIKEDGSERSSSTSQDSITYQEQGESELKEGLCSPFDAGQLEDNMLGKGQTDNDNRMIEMTISSRVPIAMCEIIFKNGTRYEGQWLNGMRHGVGIQYWHDDSHFHGQWSYNALHGRGVLTLSNGDSYEGEFSHNKAHGQGIFTSADGLKYQGAWNYGKREGFGVQIWDKNQRYEGHWENGLKQGFGKLFFTDGSYYRGTFENNQIHGKGIYHYVNSHTYDGEWSHNLKHGRGTMSWPNGDSFEGHFYQDRRHGYGEMKHGSGGSCAGVWFQGRKNGLFVERDIAGATRQVEWVMGKMASRLHRVGMAKRRKDQTENTNTADMTD